MLEELNDNLHAAEGENKETFETSSNSTSATDAINALNAQESEDFTLSESGRSEIPMKDYTSLSMEELVSDLTELSKTQHIATVRQHVEEIKKSFLEKYNSLMAEKENAFMMENPETKENFTYDFPLKRQFDATYRDIRNRLNDYYKNIQQNLNSNLEKRNQIVEEIKTLLNNSESFNDNLKRFNELRDQWKNCGAIPRDKYNHVWNNYHFQVERFYDYLDLDREARNQDFQNNLELKTKIIDRVKELLNENDINKSFRELQDLHRIWKEDIGPVSKEHREEIWNQFSELTKQMHDKREAFFQNIRGKETENLEKKNAIIAEIESYTQKTPSSHVAWMETIEKVEALRNQFFTIGKVPVEVNEETWSKFKTTVREFNSKKNNFYKVIKKEQSENLEKKQALVARANALKDSEDFQSTTEEMKRIQEEWKNIGHVPRKYTDKIWNEFKSACNHYFDRLKSKRNEANSDELIAFDKKKEYLTQLKDFQLTGVHKTDLDAIKLHIENWKSFGKVPFSRRHIEGKFNRILDILFEKLSMSKKESEMIRFNNRLGELAGGDDTRKIEQEKIFIQRKIDEVQSEIFQLENNVQFFSGNSKGDNPFLKDINKNIERLKDEKNTWIEKLKQIKNLSQE